MNAIELQDTLHATIEHLDQVADEIGGKNDDSTLARLARFMDANIDGRLKAVIFAKTKVNTRDAGFVLRCDDGSEFHITITQTR